MRKILSLFFVMALCVVGLSAQGLVQGQPHPSAPNVPVKPKSQLRADASFSFDVGLASSASAVSSVQADNQLCLPMTVKTYLGNLEWSFIPM